MDSLQVLKHNKAFDSIMWLKHNCNAIRVQELQKRDENVTNVFNYMLYLENKIKGLENVNS
jgi:hypothetical protein